MTALRGIFLLLLCVPAAPFHSSQLRTKHVTRTREAPVRMGVVDDMQKAMAQLVPKGAALQKDLQEDFDQLIADVAAEKRKLEACVTSSGPSRQPSVGQVLTRERR